MKRGGESGDTKREREQKYKKEERKKKKGERERGTVKREEGGRGVERGMFEKEE